METAEGCNYTAMLYTVVICVNSCQATVVRVEKSSKR